MAHPAGKPPFPHDFLLSPKKEHCAPQFPAMRSAFSRIVLCVRVYRKMVLSCLLPVPRFQGVLFGQCRAVFDKLPDVDAEQDDGDDGA